MGFKLSLFSSLLTLLSSFCLALFTEAKLLSLVSISSLNALETVSFNFLCFVLCLFFLSFSVSPFNFFVALCSASFRFSKSELADPVFGVKLDFKFPPCFIFTEDDLKPPDLLKLPLLPGLDNCFSIITVFFP